nr:unknown [Zea mays]
MSEKQKVISECSEAETWLMEKRQQQDALPKHANPVLLAADLKKKAETLDRFCKPIMTKPKPVPKPQTPPPAETQAPEPQTPEQQRSNGESTTSEGAAEEPPAEQMETDKPEGATDPSA